MKPLLKSAMVAEQAVVLSRIRPWDTGCESDAESGLTEIPAESGGEVAGAVESAEDRTDAAAPVMAQEDPGTYEVYRQRFEAELVALEEQARQNGFAKGQQDGREQAAAKYAAQLDALAELIASARASLDQQIDGLAEIGVEIASIAVAKIIGQVKVERDVVISIVREVIRRAKERTRLTVRVSPADWTMLQGCHDRLSEGLNVAGIDIVADDRVQLGGCLVETASGNLDGRLEVQLERLCAALMHATASAEPEGVA